MARSVKSIAMAGALALPLLFLGIPQTADSIIWFVVGGAPDQLGDASPASPTVSIRNAGLLEVAGKWLADGRALMRAGVLRLRLAARATDKPVDAAELRRAITDLREGLSLAPANAYAWAALTYAHLLSGNGAAAEKDFHTSLLLANDNVDLSLWRCELGLRLWALLNADDRQLWNNQINLAWDHRRAGLIEFARHSTASDLLAMKLALSADPQKLTSFEKAVGQRP